jgi:ABC-type nitrate/sulfonate/bicarbonate transport system substrate-binding protein
MMKTIGKWTAAVVLAAMTAGAGAGGAMAADPIKMTIGTGVDPAFSQFYVAQEAGIFKKNGLEVEIHTGSSGSAMIPFLISNQINAAYGSDIAGVINHNVDKNIVVVADGTLLLRWLSVVGKNIPDLAGLKGKRIGITKGTSGEIFWRALSKKFNLNEADYTMVNNEAPEEIAALERGDVDAFVGWEPWPTRAVMAVKGAKILIDADGILNNRNYIFMNRTWIAANPEASERFMRSMVEATDLINSNPKAVAPMVAKFLQMPLELVNELMPKLRYNMSWDDGSLQTIKIVEDQLRTDGKMKSPLDWNAYVYTDLLRKVKPAAVTFTQIPPK